TAATLLPSRLDGLTTASARTATPAASRTGGAAATATLVDVKVTTAADDWESAQQDALRSPGRRRLAGAGCTSGGTGTNAYNLSGNSVSGATTVHLNPSSAVVGGAASVVQAAFNAWKAADPNSPTIT